jgi:hypothetical protein
MTGAGAEHNSGTGGGWFSAMEPGRHEDFGAVGFESETTGFRRIEIAIIDSKITVEKGTPRGDTLFAPWPVVRDCKAAYR